MPTIIVEQFEFHQTLDNSLGTAIVFFSSLECPACRYWEQVLAEYIKANDDCKVFKVDAGKDQALTQEFGVFHLPALFLYHEGEFHSDIQCEADLDALSNAIEQALAAPAKEMP